MSYDTKCFQLAVSFLDDHPEIKTVQNVEDLAQEIQSTIEDWIEEIERNQITK